MHIAVKILIAIIAFVAIGKYLEPLLTPLAPPFGSIIVAVLFIGVIAWLLGWEPLNRKV